LRRGDFVVITGRVGSGKSTLVRVLLGLLPRQGGEIRWNGEAVAEPAEFFRPPRCAYTPQVPRLFSDTLRDNILLGLPDDPPTLLRWLRRICLAVCWRRISPMLGTRPGNAGGAAPDLRLSGGQVQRGGGAHVHTWLPSCWCSTTCQRAGRGDRAGAL
jgi:ATP-binding cassette subfamily B protein